MRRNPEKLADKKTQQENKLTSQTASCFAIRKRKTEPEADLFQLKIKYLNS